VIYTASNNSVINVTGTIQFNGTLVIQGVTHAGTIILFNYGDQKGQFTNIVLNNTCLSATPEYATNYFILKITNICPTPSQLSWLSEILLIALASFLVLVVIVVVLFVPRIRNTIFPYEKKAVPTYNMRKF